jgi:hypothetical protein
MKRCSGNFGMKVVAVIVIVAILYTIGISIGVMFFLTAVGYLVWRLARGAERRETQRIFKFYVDADEILRSDERDWYAYEIAEIIDEGDRVLNSMPDPPPLCYFTLGALYYEVGDYSGAANHLTPVLDGEWLDGRRRAAPSPQLRRYVDMLRTIERDPGMAPQALGAVRALDRLFRKEATQMLDDCRKQVSDNSIRIANQYRGEPSTPPVKSEATPTLIVPPPSIAEVLHDVYEDDQRPS